MVRLDTSCLTSSVAVDARVGAVVERPPTTSRRSIVGSIVRVSGAEDITVIGYHIDAEGVVTSSEAVCAGFDTSGIGPPTCLE